jgi:hypothetical protein
VCVCVHNIVGILTLSLRTQRLQGASEMLEKCLSRPPEQLLKDLDCFYQLRPSPMEAIMGSMSMPSSCSVIQQGSENKKAQNLMSCVAYHPTPKALSAQAPIQIFPPSFWPIRPRFFESQTLDRTPNSIHHTPYIIHHTPYTILHAPYSIHHAPYSIHHTPYTIHHTPYTIHHTPYTVHHIQCTMHHTLYTILHTPEIPGLTPQTPNQNSCRAPRVTRRPR